MKNEQEQHPPSIKWFTNIGGWLVVYGKDSKQFGECSSFNLLASALRRDKEEIPPSLKLLPEVIQFLVSVKDENPKLMAFITLVGFGSCESGFDDIAIIQNDEIIIGGKKWIANFKISLVNEINKHHKCRLGE